MQQSHIMTELITGAEGTVHVNGLGDKTLLDLLPVAVYICDREGKIVYYNEPAVVLWGYRPDLEKGLVHYCACYRVYVNGQYIMPEQTPMAAAIQGGQSFRNTEAVVERPDGTFFHASVNIDPLFDKDNKVVGAINIFQDISSHKQVETELKANEWKYRQLIECIDLPLYSTDAEGKITLYNQAAVALWGREPVIGKDMWCGSYRIKRTDGSNLPLDNCPMAVCLREQRAVHNEEILVIRPDGTERFVAPHPQPVFDSEGKMMGAINLLVDISEMKQTELALRKSEAEYRLLAASLEGLVAEKTKDLFKKTEELSKSEERYHKMIEEVEDYAILLLDKQGIVQNWNRGAQKIKGYREEEIVGKSFQEFYLPEDRQQGVPLRLLQEATQNGKALHEGWRRRKDGSVFWGSIVLTALHNEANQLIGFSKVTRDLTEKKFAEDRLKEYLTQLETQNKELEQFVYAASHDIKEPLRKINMYINFIAEHPLNRFDDRSKEYLHRSIKAANRMKNLIENLLVYSKSTLPVEGWETVNLDEIINEILDFHKEELDQKSIRVQSDALGTVQGIPFQIKQLLFNLVGNAIKYMHPGRPGIISIKKDLVSGQGIKDASIDRARTYHKISVIDNGIGFDAKFKHKIFDLFQRLENALDAKGSGVGLAICKKIAINHKGYIEAAGFPDQGARFSVYLPR